MYNHTDQEDSNYYLIRQNHKIRIIKKKIISHASLKSKLYSSELISVSKGVAMRISTKGTRTKFYDTFFESQLEILIT